MSVWEPNIRKYLISGAGILFLTSVIALIAPLGFYQAESSLIMIPDAYRPLILKKLEGLSTNIQPVQLVSSLMQTPHAQRQIEAACKELIKNTSETCVLQHYRIEWTPNTQQFSLTLRVSGSNAEAVKTVANAATQTALAIYQEQFKYGNPQIGRKLVQKLKEAKAQLVLNEDKLAALNQLQHSFSKSRLLENLNQIKTDLEKDYQTQRSHQKALLNRLGVMSFKQAKLDEIISHDIVLKALKQELHQTASAMNQAENQFGLEHPQYLALKDYNNQLNHGWRSRLAQITHSSAYQISSHYHSKSHFIETSLESQLPLTGKLEHSPTHLRFLNPFELNEVYQLALQSSNAEATKKQLQSLSESILQVQAGKTSPAELLSLGLKESQLEQNILELKNHIEYLNEQLKKHTLLEKINPRLVGIRSSAKLLPVNRIMPPWAISGIFLFCLFMGAILSQKSASIGTEEIKREPLIDFAKNSLKSSTQPPTRWNESPNRKGLISQPAEAKVEEMPVKQPLERPHLNSQNFLTQIETPHYQRKFQDILTKIDNFEEGKIIGITGNALVASGLAYFLSKTKGSVCLMDCNLPDPTLHKVFRIQNTYGLASLLRNPLQLTPVLQQALRQNPLLVLPCGEFQGTRIHDYKTFPILKKKLLQEVDYLILVAPPLTSPDEFKSFLNTTHVDKLLMVEHSTPVSSAETYPHIATHAVQWECEESECL